MGAPTSDKIDAHARIAKVGPTVLKECTGNALVSPQCWRGVPPRRWLATHPLRRDGSLWRPRPLRCVASRRRRRGRWRQSSPRPAALRRRRVPRARLPAPRHGRVPPHPAQRALGRRGARYAALHEARAARRRRRAASILHMGHVVSGGDDGDGMTCTRCAWKS